VGLLPFTAAAPAGASNAERDIQDAIKAAARAAPEQGIAEVRSAPIPAKRCPALDGRALEDKMYEGVDIRLRAENMSHGG
jgi:hypothetical protein